MAVEDRICRKFVPQNQLRLLTIPERSVCVVSNVSRFVFEHVLDVQHLHDFVLTVVGLGSYVQADGDAVQ